MTYTSNATTALLQNYLHKNMYDLKPHSHNIPYFPDHKTNFILPLKHNIKFSHISCPKMNEILFLLNEHSKILVNLIV